MCVVVDVVMVVDVSSVVVAVVDVIVLVVSVLDVNVCVSEAVVVESVTVGQCPSRSS